MVQRLDFQEMLELLLGSPNVYFQPPSNLQLQYPCVIYHRDTADTAFAGNMPYRYTKRYLLTYIDRNPDSPFPDKLAKLPYCVFDRFYTADNLNHDVFRLYLDL